MHEVIDVLKGSPAHRGGVRPGDFVESINGEPLVDEIDYQALTASRRVLLTLCGGADGGRREVLVLKRTGQPLGLHFSQTLACQPRSCANRCVFCFVDQMPPGMRETLYVKDDDWRHSLMMGNFITLTNVGRSEFERILRRKASPLYISVHATDPGVRSSMMGNPRAGDLLKRLTQLKEAGITFHTQVVLCPGLNDGDVLKDTIKTLFSLWPAVLSVGLVPVGLTRFREFLPLVKPMQRQDALQALEICRAFQETAIHKAGTRFVFPADELLCLAGADIPPVEAYEGFPQMENGVGMIRAFEEDLLQACADSPAPSLPPGGKEVEVLIPCGTSIAPFLEAWSRAHSPLGVRPRVLAIRNRFFGETVTVSGLIVAQDLEEQLRNIQGDLLLIPDVMLNHERTLFLDDRSPAWLQEKLDIPVAVTGSGGDCFYSALVQALDRSPAAGGGP